jgi:hypothetical protein
VTLQHLTAQTTPHPTTLFDPARPSKDIRTSFEANSSSPTEKNWDYSIQFHSLRLKSPEPALLRPQKRIRLLRHLPYLGIQELLGTALNITGPVTDISS